MPRVRLSWLELEDRLVPSAISDRIARAQAEAAADAARYRAILAAQQAELDRQIAAYEETLRTPHDRIESNQVILLDPLLAERGRIQTYAADFTGGTWVATGEVTGDGEADYITAPGKGAVALVRMFNGKTGSEIRSFNAYEPSFTGGAFVVTGDLTGDDIAEIITGTDRGGGPVVAIYDGAKLASGISEDRAQILRFLAIEDPNFRGGVRVGCGDVDGDGTPELVATAGFGGGPRVAVFDGQALAQGKTVKEFGDYFAFEPELRDGCYPGVGDLTGDGKGELLIGAGPGGAPVIATFDPTQIGATGPANLSRFLAGGADFRAGVRVSGFDGGDGNTYIIAADGRGGGAVVYDKTGTAIRSFDRDLALGGGLFDDSSTRNFFEPFGEAQGSVLDGLVGTYRGTTQAPVLLFNGFQWGNTETVPVTVELRIDELLAHDLANDPKANGGTFTARGRVRVEVPGHPVLDQPFEGTVELDPFPNMPLPQSGTITFGTNGVGALAGMSGVSMRWDNGRITGNGVDFVFNNEFFARTLGLTNFEWTRVV